MKLNTGNWSKEMSPVLNIYYYSHHTENKTAQNKVNGYNFKYYGVIILNTKLVINVDFLSYTSKEVILKYIQYENSQSRGCKQRIISC